jgi:RNA-directed DNA polymerase
LVLRHILDEIWVVEQGEASSVEVGNAAKTSIRKAIRKVLNKQWTNTTLEAIANVLNPKIKGWINYYGKFFKWRMIRIFDYLDGLLQRWIARKYKLIAKAKTLAEFHF